MSDIYSVVKKYYSKENLQNAVDFIKNNGIHQMKYISTRKIPLKLHYKESNNLIGGKSINREFTVDSNIYVARIDEFDDYVKKPKRPGPITYIRTLQKPKLYSF